MQKNTIIRVGLIVLLTVLLGAFGASFFYSDGQYTVFNSVLFIGTLLLFRVSLKKGFVLPGDIISITAVFASGLVLFVLALIYPTEPAAFEGATFMLISVVSGTLIIKESLGYLFGSRINKFLEDAGDPFRPKLLQGQPFRLDPTGFSLFDGKFTFFFALFMIGILSLYEGVLVNGWRLALAFGLGGFLILRVFLAWALPDHVYKRVLSKAMVLQLLLGILIICAGFSLLLVDPHA